MPTETNESFIPNLNLKFYLLLFINHEMMVNVVVVFFF